MDGIVVKDHGVEVLEAPEMALMSLQMLKIDRAYRVDGDIIMVGTRGFIAYRVTGWDPKRRALILTKVLP